MNQQNYRKLVSGQSTRLASSLLRLLLGIAACGYSLVIRLRNLLYSRGWFKTHRVNAAVISIGNITAGGTGKTPLVVWLCKEIVQNPKLKTKNCQCAVLTRGYKAGQGPLLDEPAILADRCPGARVVVNPDRVAGAVDAVAVGANVLIMDDGFQHRRLARDLDIVAIDATMPFGFGRMLPAGLLREPVAGLKRANAVVITRCDQIAEDRLAEIENRIRHVKADIVIAGSIHAPVCVVSADDGRISPDEIEGKKILAFCGIGNPDAFLNSIKALGADLLGSAVFDDHCHYSKDSLDNISNQARRLQADLVLTTQKDWTKIAPLLEEEKHALFAFLAVEIRFQTGQNKLISLIENAITGRI